MQAEADYASSEIILVIKNVDVAVLNHEPRTPNSVKPIRTPPLISSSQEVRHSFPAVNWQ